MANQNFQTLFHPSKFLLWPKWIFPQFCYDINQRKSTSPFAFFKCCYFKPCLVCILRILFLLYGAKTNEYLEIVYSLCFGATSSILCNARYLCNFWGWNIDPWYFSMSDISRSAGAHHGLKLRLNALIGFFLPMAEGHKITHVLSFSPLQFFSTWKENLEKAKYSQTLCSSGI